jgi:exosortase C (VPDSG-CTERM-specific)
VKSKTSSSVWERRLAFADLGRAGGALDCEPLWALTVFTAVCAVAFIGALLAWWRFAPADDLYSYMLLVPFLSLYLAWTERDRLVPCQRRPSLDLPAVLGGAGLLVFSLWWAGSNLGWSLSPQDRLFLAISAGVALLLASAAWFVGAEMMQRLGLPAALLFLTAPLPKEVEAAFELFLQHASAATAAALFHLAGIPIVRRELVCYLPNIILQVSPECSGIRSTLILLITSLAVGYLYLRTTRSRLILSLLVIPLGILRNALRIVTIGWLCVRVDPGLIHSWVHRKGGPWFFALSWMMLLALLLLLRRWERGTATAAKDNL